MNNDKVIDVRDLVVGFGERTVLDHVTFDVRRGEVFGFVGGSGSGKSVLLRTIIGLIPRRAGSIEVLGTRLDTATAEQRRGIERRWGVLFQQGALFSSLTVKQNVQFPMIEYLDLPQRLMDETLFERLENLSFRPGSLSFELLESISFDGEDKELTHQIERLKALGADIEIDDFGSGPASIVTLLKLHPRRLKIDRQLVIPLLESQAQQQLVSSIIEIGRSRGIEIVAEGVETMAHAEILRDLGCDILQGYALAKPMSPADLIGFVSERRWMASGEGLIRKA